MHMCLVFIAELKLSRSGNTCNVTHVRKDNYQPITINQNR